MADPAPGADAPTERRHRRNDRKRRRIRRVAGGLGALVVVGALVVFATGIVHFGDDEQPSVANTVAAGHDAAATTTTVATKQCRALSAADPLRLWVGGDSLAGSLGPSLGTIAGATGVVQPYFDSRVSSGLADPGFFDWPDHATTEMARLNPDVVVFFIGTNDFSAVSGDWKADYEAKVDSMMKTLIGSGRTVYWLGAPTLKDEKMDAPVVEVNAAAQEVAKRHPKVHY